VIFVRDPYDRFEQKLGWDFRGVARVTGTEHGVAYFDVLHGFSSWAVDGRVRCQRILLGLKVLTSAMSS
jgi:hypothetical protein